MLPPANLRRLNSECAAALLAAYQQVVTSGSLVLSKEVGNFERAWAAQCGMRFCVGTGNGLDALRLLLVAHGVTSKDVVAVAGNTHIATWMAPAALGATLLPIDPDPKTHLIGPREIEATPGHERITVILATHLYGGRCDVEGLQALAEKLGAFLFFDACQGHGLQGFGDGAAFSFYPTKNLGALGDGGAVVVNDLDTYQYLLALRNYGGVEQNHHLYPAGWNSRLDELQAAFLNAKLAWLDQWNLRRQNIACRYRESLKDLGCFELPMKPESHVYHQFVVTHPQRDAFRKRLQARGIGTLVHYPTPPHKQPMFAAWTEHRLPVSERLAREVLSLPISPELYDEEVEQVIEAIRWCA